MSKRERVYIVDENDNVIDEKWRDETIPADRIRIVGVWIENSSEQVLIAQRSYRKKIDQGLWGPAVAGTVEAGDSYESTAVRELIEEINLDINSLSASLIAVDKINYGTEKTGLRIAARFKIFVDLPISSFKIDSNEVEKIKWIDKKILTQDITKNPDNYVPHFKADIA